MPTAEPTEQTPAAEPTDLSTAEPFVPVASCGPGYEGKYVIRSSYDWWLEETCRAILEGRLSDVKFPENVDKFVHFAGDSTHEFVNANSSSVTIYHGDDGTGEVETVNDCPVFKIPYDIAVKAQNSMFDHFEEVGPRLLQRSDELFFECGGFCGEDWFVLQSEQWLNLVSQRIHTIWRRDESGNWYEFG
ncbi:MAG: hypothetical protein J6P98_08040, partial [Clostridia bacterium]|nr:hypothetical protein [Clostridia bacterium]